MIKHLLVAAFALAPAAVPLAVAPAPDVAALVSAFPPSIPPATAAFPASISPATASATSVPGTPSAAPTRAGAEPPAPATDMDRAVEAIFSDPLLAGSLAEAVVADARTGAVLADHNGTGRMLPASNTKLLTSAAALHYLGPDHSFATSVLSTGHRTGTALTGDLYLRGSGDPALTPDAVDALAASVAATGLRTVTGTLVADDTAFDDHRLGLDWAWDDESFYGAAPVSALSVSPDNNYLAGTVNVVASPAPPAQTPATPNRPAISNRPATSNRSAAHNRPATPNRFAAHNHPAPQSRPAISNRAAVADRPAVVSLSPATGLLTVVNRTTTDRNAPDWSVTREHGGNVLTVTGRVSAVSTQSVTVPSPTALAAELFRTDLLKHGVQVKGRTLLSHRTPATATVQATHDGPPLRALLPTLLKLSDNNMAELLIKAIGHRSWEGGTAAVAAYLRTLHIDPSALRQVDGSGLSRRNLISPMVLTRLLVAVRSEPWFPLWYASLPVAADPDPLAGGTLRNRMRNTPAAGNVHAKTGTLTGVSALSGYVTDATHRPLVFSAIINNQLATSVTPVLDRLAVTLASWPHLPRAAFPAAPHAPADRECTWTQPASC